MHVVRYALFSGKRSFNGAKSNISQLLDADAIKIRAGVRSGGVRVTRRADLADDVALDGGECRLRRKIGAALEIIRSRVHTLPAYGHAR